MAYYLRVQPPTIALAYNPIISVLESTNNNQTDFAYVIDVYSGTTTTTRLARIPISPDPQGYGIWDASKVLQCYLTSTPHPSLTGATELSDEIKQFNLQYGEQYQYVWSFTNNFSGSVASVTYPSNVGLTGSTPHYKSVGDTIRITQQSNPTNPQYDGVHTIVEVPNAYAFIIDTVYGTTPASAETGTTIYADERVTIFTGYSSASTWAINAAQSYLDFIDYDSAEFDIKTSNLARFLTDVPNYYRLERTCQANLNAFSFNAQTGFLNIITDDGNTGIISLTGATISGNRTCFGVGPWNLNNTTLATGTQPLITANTTRYSAYTTTLVGLSFVRNSEIKIFDVYDKCSPYEQYQIIFKDQLGSYISFSFDLASTKNLNIEKKEYKQIQGTYNPSLNTWGYNSYDRGRTIFNVDTTKEYTVTSNWVTESESDYLSQMFQSPEVYHIDSNNNWLPIIITSNSYQYKQRVKDKLINITMTFQYANRDPVSL